jgi:hypothetical protein
MNWKKLVILAVPATLVVGAAGVMAAQSASPPPAPAATETNDQQPSYTGSVTVPQNANDDGKALAPLAKISAQQATQAALAKYPGGTVVGAAQLEDENGNVVYGVEVKAADGKTYDVKVDAGNGKVLSSEAGGSDAGETAAETESTK